MDGIHDMGGRQGFGPVDVKEPEEVFHEAWEGRVWGIVRSHETLARLEYRLVPSLPGADRPR